MGNAPHASCPASSVALSWKLLLAACAMFPFGALPVASDQPGAMASVALNEDDECEDASAVQVRQSRHIAPESHVAQSAGHGIRQQLSLGVIRLDYPLITVCGDPDDPATYPYDVRFATIPGFTIEVVENANLTMPPCVQQGLFDGMDQLIADGVDAITGNDGFMIKYQPLLRSRSGRTPVILSALVCLSLVRRLYADVYPIAIITANGTALKPLRPIITNVTGEDPWEHPYLIYGAQNVPGFQAIKNGTIPDYKLICPGIVALAKSIVAQQPVAAFVFECTELPPCADSVRRELALPVHDYLSCVNSVVHQMGDAYGKGGSTCPE